MEWVLTQWSPCSSTCGSGTKSREVKCPELDMCNPDSKPNEVMNCVEKPCIDWVPGPWTTCSVSCGGGHQYRAVQCMDRRISSPVEGCDQLEKPRQRQRCGNENCRSSSHHVPSEVKGWDATVHFNKTRFNLFLIYSFSQKGSRLVKTN